MPDTQLLPPALDPAKFKDPDVTAAGETRAHVALEALGTLWINTGTLCNLECAGCYIDSSPTNDRLAYITAGEVETYLNEIARLRLATREVGFTGGEPFMNPDLVAMLAAALARGFRALVLTNAMKPMHHKRDALAALRDSYGDALEMRVSIDHPSRARHEELRGPRSWEPMVEGVRWLAANGFNLAIAGRTIWGEDEAALRRDYATLFADLGLSVDAADPARLVLFPEMDARLDVPEITTACWGLLNVDPRAMMCATSRMVVKRKGAPHPVVVACTLLPDDPQFELGRTLAEAQVPVKLNHPHCARFCVLGGGACSVA